MNKVSVIIPVFNNKDTLERAVLSVVADPYVSDVLIVDDGSKDGGIALAHELAEKHSKIKVLEHEGGQNKGASASRNLGLSQAQSNWIQFLDADDELLPEKVSGQLKMVNPETALVVGNSIHVFPDGRKHYRKSDQDVWKGLIRSKLGDTCSNLWNKNYLLHLKGWNEKLESSQEYDLMFRLLSVFPKVVFDQRYLTSIYKTENSISSHPKMKDRRIKNWMYLRQRIRKYLIDHKKFNLRNQYIWSGAVGKFCKVNFIDFPIEVNRYLYFLYSFEIWIKIKLYQIFIE